MEAIKSTIPKNAVSKILVADSPLLKNKYSFELIVLTNDKENNVFSLAQPLAQVLSGLITSKKYTNLLVDSSSCGKDVLPRVAAKFGSQPASDVTSILVKII